MPDELFFLRLIVRSLPAGRPVIADALREIRSPAYRAVDPRGYRQFLLFMAAVREHSSQQMDWAAKRPSTAELVLERDGEPIAAIDLLAESGSKVIAGIVPGRYALVLETGRLLWQGTLSGADLFWREARPGRPLELAADTGEPGIEPVRQIGLGEAGLIIRVFPGLEAGSLEIERQA